ncbi:MAG: S41 family peptidase [Candidatus Aureabacteria bacterium]|nr:S41 family peptidase [Candidatus Auribacterota bacterium]
MKKIFVLITSILFVATLSYSALDGEKVPSQPDNDIYKQMEQLAVVFAIVEKDYVDDVDQKKLVYGAMKGIIAELDPHSQFMEPEMYKEMKVETEGEFGGLGIEITIRDSLLTVISPMEGTPAERAGLKTGDKIIKIDGESTKDMTLMEAVNKLRGKPGTKVHIVVLRSNQKVLDFDIVRAVIKVESIKDAKILEDDIGYIRIVQFQENTGRDFEKALTDLESRGMKSLIIDLRNNPGGLLQTAVEVADRFVENGKVIVSIQGKLPSQNVVFNAKGRTTHKEYPIVILINTGSASGSEIVAGALKDHKKAILIGEKTFGKGSVQSVIPLNDGSALRLTTAKYFTPSGVTIHGVGITPDIEVDISDEEEVKLALKKYAELEKTLKQGEQADNADNTEKNAIDEEEVKDVQLQRAMDLLKAMDIFNKTLSDASFAKEKSVN